jgi:hypothetical protein
LNTNRTLEETDMEKATRTAEEVSEVLRSQHREIGEMLMRVAVNRGAVRDSAFTALRRFLAAHEAAEDTFIHRVTGSAVALERVREEEEVREAIVRLEAIDPATRAFEDAFALFSRLLMRHAEAEELKELPALTGDASGEELGRMYDALLKVPELAGQQDGPVRGGEVFSSMLADAKAEFATASRAVASGSPVLVAKQGSLEAARLVRG